MMRMELQTRPVMYHESVRMGAGGDALPGERSQWLVKLTESHALIVKESPDGLRGGKGGLLGTGDIFNRTAERVCGCHMKFNQRVIKAVKPGIRPGKREIKSMLKSNSINHNKCVDTYVHRREGKRWRLTCCCDMT